MSINIASNVKKNNSFKFYAETAFKKIKPVLKSLKEYDEGKKKIETNKVRAHYFSL